MLSSLFTNTSKTYIFAQKQKNPQTAVTVWGSVQKLLSFELVKAGTAYILAVELDKLFA